MKSHDHVDILEVRAEVVVESVQDRLIGVIRCDVSSGASA